MAYTCTLQSHITEVKSDSLVERGGAAELQDMKYKREGQEALEVSWRILNSPDWRLEKQTAEGDTTYSKMMPRVGKVFKLTVSRIF
jgi:hypothetical protein